MTLTPALRALAIALALCVGACGDKHSAAPSAFAGRLADWRAELARQEPESAFALGAAPALALTDRSALAGEQRRNAALRRLAELRALDVSALSVDEIAVHEALMSRFETAAASADHASGQFSIINGPRPYALDHRTGAVITIPDLLIAHRGVASSADARAYVRLLNALPAVIDAELDVVQSEAVRDGPPPARVIDATLARFDPSATLAALEADFTRKTRALAETERAALTEEAREALSARVAPAFARAHASLRDLRIGAPEAPGVWRRADGGAYYRHALAFAIGEAAEPQALERAARARMRALVPALDVALRRIGMTDGSVGARLTALRADPRRRYGADDSARIALMREVTAHLGAITAAAPRAFARLNAPALEARPTPAYAEARAQLFAYAPPRAGQSDIGVFRVNLALVGEADRIDMPAAIATAAGAHVRLAYQADAPIAPLIGFTATREGWDAYFLALADELGVYSGDPLGAIGALRAQMRVAALAVADAGVHERRWSSEDAIAFLIEASGDTAAEASRAVDDIAAEPGRAGAREYGRAALARMREDARNALGPDFDLAEFHAEVLAHSYAPPAQLARITSEWRRARAAK